ncbi:hypothetical protein AB1Y20_002375 [Prymnesium parvum]|uniref:Amino acid permease/ SLC12A domain-containing protein n=1 Tax=Prymnesium parvum TaxID=97485 RepID=A0AB34J8X7_PRYPA
MAVCLTAPLILSTAADPPRTRLLEGREDGRTASFTQLVAIGVGGVISGDFFGWQAALAGGFWNGLVALLLVSVFYCGLCLSVAEVAATLTTATGPAQFARLCLGPRCAFAVAVAESLKILLVVAVITVGVAAYLVEIVRYDAAWSPLVWLLVLLLDAALLMLGGALSLNVQCALTGGAVAMLLTFYGAALAQPPELALATNGSAPAPWSNELDAAGVLASCPFCFWFFLGAEELPLARPLAREPRLLAPALKLTLACLTVLAFCTYVLSSTIAPGAAELSLRPYPLLEGYRACFGDSSATNYACLVLTTGLVSSLHSFLFAAGEMLSACADDGYLPAVLAWHSTRAHTPVTALAFAAIAAYSAVLTLHYAIDDDLVLGAVLMTAVLAAAMVSYLAQLACFLVLRHNEEQPSNSNDRSLLGRPGAMVTIGLACASIGCVGSLCFQRQEYAYGPALSGVAALLWGGVYLSRGPMSRVLQNCCSRPSTSSQAEGPERLDS